MSGGNETFVESLKRSGAINNSIIAMYINDVGVKYDGYGDPPSNLQIGSYNLSKYSTSPSFTVVASVITPPQFWDINISSVYIGNYQINSGINIATIDSGTSLIYIPSYNYYQMLSYLVLYSGENCDYDNYINTVACKCNSADKLMGFTIKVNGTNLSIPASSIWLYSKRKCYLLILESDFWLIGDVFLRNFYTVYDMDNLTVSFAPAVKTKRNHSSYLCIALLFYSIFL